MAKSALWVQLIASVIDSMFSNDDAIDDDNDDNMSLMV